MLKLAKIMWMAILATVVLFGLTGRAANAEDYEPVKSQLDKYNKAGDDNERIEVIKKFMKTEPKTQEDVDNLRKVFLKKDWDEKLFVGAKESLKRVKDPAFDKTLIEILKDEKTFIEKTSRKDKSGKSDIEVDYRVRNVEFIIYKLTEFKSQSAIPVLKEYLAIKGAAYWASEALAKLGDKSSIQDMKEKAYKGEEINYGGQGLDEAITIVRDLEDKTKKDQWPKIAKQLFHIRDRKVKPYLIRLFKHEVMDVRWEAAGKFRAMVDENDVPTIIEMSKNQDHILRAEAMHAMKNLKNVEFGDELIALLNDNDSYVRSSAAKAIGYKKISRAVPYLEQALRDGEQRANSHSTGSSRYHDELRVCEEAYIALYVLTGRKYDYKGKTAVIEFKAEEQSRFPSFY